MVFDMCIFEVLHFLPMALIAAAALFGSKFSNISAAIMFVASVVGLASGAHTHVEHFVEVSMFDYCYMYAVSLAYSSYKLVKAAANAFAKA